MLHQRMLPKLLTLHLVVLRKARTGTLGRRLEIVEDIDLPHIDTKSFKYRKIDTVFLLPF